MFKRLEEQYNEKETLTQLEERKKALKQLRDLKRVINSDEIEEHALVYKKSKGERLEEISLKRKEEVKLMKERQIQLKKYQIPKKGTSSNGSVADGEGEQSKVANVQIFSSLMSVNSLQQPDYIKMAQMK